MTHKYVVKKIDSSPIKELNKLAKNYLIFSKTASQMTQGSRGDVMELIRNQPGDRWNY